MSTPNLCPYCGREPHWADEICKYDIYDMGPDFVWNLDQEVKYITGTGGKLMRIVQPCPFCGNEPIVDYELRESGGRDSFYTIRCEHCDMNFGKYWSIEKDKCIDKWNKRVC